MPKNPKPHELRKRETRLARGIEKSRYDRIVLPERHLFVTEGTKTEPYYIEGLISVICEKYGSEARKQFSVIGEGANTLSLLEKAEAYQQNEATDYQHVWIIYDQDDFPADSFDNTEKRCEALNKRFRDNGSDLTFHAIWSNECIELWFLLHFAYQDSNISRDEYREKLSGYLGRHYEKSDATIFATLRPKMSKAIKHAKKLMNSYSANSSPSQMAPCTKVYELLEYLSEYIE